MRPTARARIYELATAWIACAYVIFVVQSAVGRAAVLAFVGLGSLVGPRIPFGAFGQRILLAALLVGTFFARGFLLPPVAPGDAVAGLFATISLLAVSALCGRLFFRTPEWGPPVTITLGFTAFLAAGQVKQGAVYGLAVTAFLACSVVWTWAQDPARPPFREAFVPMRRQWALAVALAAVFALGAVRALPWLHDKGIHFLTDHFDDEVESGFSGNMSLDAMDGMLQSDVIALRVYGPSDEYLRGAVFNRYAFGRWVVGNPPPIRTVASLPAPPPETADRVEVRRVNATPSWLFVPLRAQGLAMPGEQVRVGAFGMVYAVAGQWEQVWFHRGDRDVAPVDPPGPWDSRVPRHLRPHIAPLAARWTRPSMFAAERAAVIAQHLSREWTYSLSRRRDASVDPVVDFLERDRRGHCEYFATALALLCRTAKIPARVVTGYRAHERSPVGNHLVVRERNAHAWVEVWLDDHQWHTIDATPEASRRSSPSRWSRWKLYAAEIASLGFERARLWFLARSPLEIAAMIAPLALLFMLGRWWRARGARARKDARDRSLNTPLTCWTELEQALGALGAVRPGFQTLEDFAGALRHDARLGALGERIAAATERYAALRYGSLGDEGVLTAEMNALTSALKALSRAKG